MPSFSNRPGYGEPLPLSNDYQAIPRAPRAPHFPEPSARGHYGPEPSARGHQYNPTGPFQPHSYAATGPFPAQSARSMPSAPNSLSPVAMASARSAVATGPQQTMDTGPSRPSAKAGMSILLAGAIIGGLIGAVMHARQNAADAFAAAQEQRDHEIAMIASALPTIAPPTTPPPAPQVIAPPEKVSAKEDTKKADNTKKADEKKTTTKRWTPPSRSKATVASASNDEESTPSKKKKAKDDDDGYTVASADGKGSSDTKAEKSEPKPSKKDVSAKSEKPEKTSDKPSKASKGGDDAVNVLKAAMGATENTL